MTATDALRDAIDERFLPRTNVLLDIHAERELQDAKFPEQHDLPDGTGGEHSRSTANMARAQCNDAHTGKSLTWKHILREEYAEAMAETEPALLRAELVQVAAVAVKWIEWIDKRPAMIKAELAKLPA